MDMLDRASHRLKLRDLRLLLSVIETGGMAKAAAQHNLTQSGVSKAIADIEHTLNVRLLIALPVGSSRRCMVLHCASGAMPFSTICARASRKSNTLPIPQLASCGSAARKQ
jgi:hypothetical protein